MGGILLQALGAAVSHSILVKVAAARSLSAPPPAEVTVLASRLLDRVPAIFNVRVAAAALERSFLLHSCSDVALSWLS